METRKSRFDDHMSTIEAAHSKTAAVGAGATAGNALLVKLAEELGIGDAKDEAAAATAAAAAGVGAQPVTAQGAPAQGAPIAEGEVIPAASGIAAAAPAVEAATDAVAMPQVALAGGVPEIMEAGGQPNVKEVVMPVISAADGKVETASDLGRTPEAVAAAAEPTNKEDSIEDKEAEKVGALIARSFQATLDKQASDGEYAEAVEFLKEAGMLDNYNIKDEGIAKVAGVADGFLEKIANMKPLNRADIVGAAYELAEFQKQAELAEQEGRETAGNLVEMLSKVAKGEAAPAVEAAGPAVAAAAPAADDAQTKVAALLQDPEVVASVKVLKAKGLL